MLMACPGNGPALPEWLMMDTDMTTGEDGDTTMGPTTTPTTISPDSDVGDLSSGDSETTVAGPCAGIECPEGEQCIGGSCFTCGQPTCKPACVEGETCQCAPDDLCCDMGTCEPPVCPLLPVEGNFADCIDDMNMISDMPCGGATCTADNSLSPTAAVCTPSGCEMDCQCPAAPPTGDAPVVCEDVTGDGTNDCSLDCSNGETCPDGMLCYNDFICLFSNAAPVDVPLYGDCVNTPPGSTCVDGGCLNAPGYGACTANCGDVADCEPAPPTGDATLTCDDVTGDRMDDCYLGCDSGQTCPDGMECFMNVVCLWPEVVPLPPGPSAYGDCADNPVSTCQPGEGTCLSNAGGTAAACSHGGCVVVGDCPAAPPTGDAPVACGNLGGGNTCYLDCGGGQACPDGTICTAVGGSMACLWPDDGFLLDEDFELGTFRPGWSVIDVDGQTPDNSVSFVTDAYVVTDVAEPGVNFGAYSTSWYVPAGQADDWLITPQIMLGPASFLSWEAWAPDPVFPDGYEVRVSTGMPTVVGFMANPALFTIADEAQVFTLHAVDLAAAGYANEAVYIAWRNNSNDDFLLVVDDVQITE
jgi:hypothetical protein